MAGENRASNDPVQLLDAAFALQRRIWLAWTDLPGRDSEPSQGNGTGQPGSLAAATMAQALRNQIACQAAWSRWYLSSLPGGGEGDGKDPTPSPSTHQPFEHLSLQWLNLNRRLGEAWLDALTAHPAAGWSAPFALTRGMLDGWLSIQQEWQDQGTWARLLHAGEIRRQVPEEEPPPEVEELEDMAKAAAVDARRQRRSGTEG